MTAAARGDEAMLAYLAGDNDVQAAADQIWDATGRLLNAQHDLETATNAYTQAITDTGVPTERVERVGATLILRLHRQRLVEETERTSPEDEPST